MRCPRGYYGRPVRSSQAAPQWTRGYKATGRPRRSEAQQSSGAASVVVRRLAPSGGCSRALRVCNLLRTFMWTTMQLQDDGWRHDSPWCTNEIRVLWCGQQSTWWYRQSTSGMVHLRVVGGGVSSSLTGRSTHRQNADSRLHSSPYFLPDFRTHPCPNSSCSGPYAAALQRPCMIGHPVSPRPRILKATEKHM